MDVILFLLLLSTSRPFSTPTASMQPTIMIGDLYAGDIVTWGYGPHSFVFPLPLGGRLGGRLPVRGEVAVFYNAPTGENSVKRIIGLPGDHIQMRHGRLYLNDEQVPRREIGTRTDVGNDGVAKEVIVYEETLSSGVHYLIQEVSDSEILDETPEFTVPEGHYFVLGDNRDRSADTRVLRQVGYVALKNLVARLDSDLLISRVNEPKFKTP